MKNKNTKAKILNASIKLFAQYGYDGVGIRRIAKEAGVNSSMISYYFGNKENLYKTVLSLYLDEFKTIVMRLPIKNEQQFLKEFIKHHIRILKKRGKYIALIIARESVEDFERSKDFFNEFLKEIKNKIETVFRQGIKKGFLKDIDPVVLTRILIGIDIIFAFKIENLDEKTTSHLAYHILMDGIKRT